MRRLTFLFLILLFSASGLFSQNLNLDAAIREAGKKINDELPQGSLAAVVSIDAVSVAMSDYIAGELTAYLVNGKKINMINRENINSLEDELNFQLSGAVSDEYVQTVGILLSADFIITGAFTEMAGGYRFRVQVVNTGTTVIISTVTLNVQGGPQITALTAPDSNGVRPGRKPGEGPRGQYRIGNYGPGGGIVFYDKGIESAGWRYLEVAPAETEKTLTWGNGITGVRTSGAAGTGGRNTETLVKAMKLKNMNNTAAVYCYELEFGGFDDWHLPSISDLDHIYKNLKSKGIGGFDDAVYWSSGLNGGMCSTYQFKSGTPMESHPADTAKVRAVRAFK